MDGEARGVAQRASGRTQKQDNREEVREWRRCCLVSVVADMTIGLGRWFEGWDLYRLEGEKGLVGKHVVHVWWRFDSVNYLKRSCVHVQRL